MSSIIFVDRETFLLLRDIWLKVWENVYRQTETGLKQERVFFEGNYKGNDFLRVYMAFVKEVKSKIY